MGAESNATIFAGGQLYADPSDQTDPSTGTELGTVQSVAVEWVEYTEAVTAEEYGGEEVDADFLFAEVFLRVTFANFDQAAWEAHLPNVSTGTSGPVAEIPSAGTVPGASQKARAVKLLWKPRHNGVSGSEDPGFLAISAYPERGFRRVVKFRDSEPAEVEVLYRCTRESGDLLLRFAALEDQS